jgi:CelD/BcsL family acetyltransferase involved in cellulose biosynthesis
MKLQRGPSLTPAGPRQPQPRRGAFALEPVDALPRLAERVTRLAERSLEPNPFFLPEFLEPAIHALGRRSLKLATFSDREDLRFFAPVTVRGGRLAGLPRLTVWSHAYAPLGAPLLDRDLASQVADGVIKHLRTSARAFLSIPDLPLEGPTAETLRAAAKRATYWVEAGVQMRPILAGGGAADGQSFDAMVTQRRRHELERQLRRLCETGLVSFMSAQSLSDVESAFNMFIMLESSGWKGRRGTALLKRQAIHDFARVAVMQLAAKGLAKVDVLRVGSRPAAALIRLDHRGLSIPWKIAYDEALGQYSPGRQLICDESRRWLADPSVRRIDPVCEEGNPLFAGLWGERERYGTLFISARPWSPSARVRSALLQAKFSLRRSTKLLLGGNRPKRRPRRSAAAAARTRRAKRPRHSP